MVPHLPLCLELSRTELHNHQRTNMESSVGWGEAVTLQHRTGERIWECPTASSAAFPDSLFLSQGIPLLPGPPTPRSPGGYDHFLFHYVPRTGLGLVPKEEKCLFRVNQARKGASTSMETGLLEPHPRVPRPQEH